MDVAGDDFLADAALTGDEHLGIGSRHALHFVLQRNDFRAATNQFHVGLHPHTGKRIGAATGVYACRCHRHVRGA